MIVRAVAVVLAALLAAVFGCDQGPKAGPETAASGSGPGASAKPPAPGPATTVVIAYGSEKKTWLEEQAKKFEAGGAKTKSGRAIRIDARALGSGEAVQGIVDGSLKAHVFSPASAVYVALLNDAWMQTAGHNRAISPAGEPLVLSPIVVAMWKPMAEALGWPGKSIGWGDLLKVRADPKGWASFGHPEWGAIKLGHTHPDFSNSGFLAVLAEAYAGAKKTRGLSAADLDAPATRKFVESVEATMVHYGKSTGFFADKMIERGPGYISAAVLYENLVIESYSAANKPQFPLVAIYPVEGTFWSDHPYSVLDADWVGAEEREAAEAFLAFLKARPQQERALALGFRPADLRGDWVTDAQRAAARTWVAYLRSRPVQEKALAYGFRPGDPAVPIKTADAQNPFSRLAQYGIQIDIPPVAQAPDGTVIRNLMTMWSRVVQR